MTAAIIPKASAAHLPPPIGTAFPRARSARAIGGAVDARRDERAVLEPERLDRAAHRVDQPGVPDAEGGVERQLLEAIHLGGRHGQDLADPVRWHREEGALGDHRHPLAPPRGKVGDDDLVGEMELGLV